MRGISQLIRCPSVRNHWPCFIVFLLLLATAPSAVVQEAAWSAPDPGFLRDAHFDGEQRGERKVWGRSQHAGQRSYHFSFMPGELQIERIGPEPWGQVKQIVDAKPLVGQTQEFSAELSGSFSEPERRPISVTGLGVRIKGYKAGLPPFAGKGTLLIADVEPEIGPHHYDWTSQSVRFRVPEGATDIQVSIRLGMHGTTFGARSQPCRGRPIGRRMSLCWPFALSGRARDRACATSGHCCIAQHRQSLANAKHHRPSAASHKPAEVA